MNAAAIYSTFTDCWLCGMFILKRKSLDFTVKVFPTFPFCPSASILYYLHLPTAFTVIVVGRYKVLFFRVFCAPSIITIIAENDDPSFVNLFSTKLHQY